MRLSGRSSGVLLHPTSLPGPHGIGDAGPAARRFVDFLAGARQRWWQMLPVGPPGAGNSPYMSDSAFAGSPWLVNLPDLKLLPRADVEPLRDSPRGRVRYDTAARFKEERLRAGFALFRRRPYPRFDQFRRSNAAWLPDYALFCALKSRQGGAPWCEWERPLRLRDTNALRRARRDLAFEVEFHEFVQFAFATQWQRLRDFAARRGVGLIGDVPIYVSHDSADVWSNQSIFELDDRGRPTVVAGVRPDYFSRTGQRWGNPMYRWDALGRLRYDWWVRRLRVVFARFDVARLDHFIGFVRGWAIPSAEATAVRGRYRPGPGAALLEAVRRDVPRAEFIAEDLGVVVPEVRALRDRFAFPGLRVLQFAFGDDPEADSHKPHNHVPRSVVCTGTHDNDTIVGWWRDRGGGHSTRTPEQIRRERATTVAYTGTDGREIHWDMIRVAMTSVAETAIVPAQDLLGLGTECRMNRPGTPDGNWEWRLREGALTRAVGDRLRATTLLTQRGGGANER